MNNDILLMFAVVDLKLVIYPGRINITLQLIPVFYEIINNIYYIIIIL